VSRRLSFLRAVGAELVAVLMFYLTHRTIICMLACAVALCVPRADAQTFTKIADLNTPIPDGIGKFTSLTLPQVSLGNVVFAGGTNNQIGIYRFDPASGALSTIVDARAPLPGGSLIPGLGLSQLGLSVYGPDVSFLGFSVTPLGYRGSALYTTRGGLHKVPGGNQDYLFGAPPEAPTSMDDKHIAFGWTWHRSVSPDLRTFGTVYDSGGVFVRNSEWTVDRFLARDGGTMFSSWFTSTSVPQRRYLASSAGTLEFSDGGISGVLTPNVFLPTEPASSYTFLGTNAVFNDDGDSVAFVAYSSPDKDINHRTQWGIYAKTGFGPLRTVANNHRLVPGRADGATFANFDAVAIDGPNIVFIGSAANRVPGIFVESDRVLWELIGVGDELDGKTVTGLTMSDDRPLSGNDVVFTATFSDASQGLYYVRLPEPAGLLLVAGAVVILGRRSSRRRD
jgi:hypothetical protein